MARSSCRTSKAPQLGNAGMWKAFEQNHPAEYAAFRERLNVEQLTGKRFASLPLPPPVPPGADMIQKHDAMKARIAAEESWQHALMSTPAFRAQYDQIHWDSPQMREIYQAAKARLLASMTGAKHSE
jgi:hypothetical protein